MSMSGILGVAAVAAVSKLAINKFHYYKMRERERERKREKRKEQKHFKIMKISY